MHQTFSFITPIDIKGFEMPSLSSQMMYLMTTDIEQQGKAAILRQLARLFEVDIEEFLHPVLDQLPEILMRYNPFGDEWEYLGEPGNKTMSARAYQLARSMNTGETDDETTDFMQLEGWSSFVGLKEEIDKILQLITAYPFFWRAIKYKDQSWLKPYFEQPNAEHSGDEKIITAFGLDVQELARFCAEANQQKLLWFAKY